MRRFILAISVVFAFVQALGQAHHVPFTVNLTAHNGFPANTIYDIQDDASGYIWIATDNGLFRYDGYDYTQIQHIPGDDSTIPSNQVSVLMRDSHNQLWIGAGSYICLWNEKRQNFKRYSINEELNTNYGILNIVEAPNGELWICNEYDQISIFNPIQRNFTAIPPIEVMTSIGPRNPRIKAIHFIDNQTAWLGSFQGLIKYNLADHSFTQYNSISNKKEIIGIINDIEPDPTDPDLLWLGTWGQGLICFNTKNNESKQYTFETGPVNLSNIIFDVEVKDDHALWVTTNGLGIFDTENRTFQLPLENEKGPRKISNQEIRLFHRGDNQMLWLGTADGISILDPSQQMFDYTLFHSDVSCVYLLKDKSLNQYYGLNLYNQRQLTLYDGHFNVIGSWPIPEADAKSSEPVSLFQDRENQIWIGTIRSGTWRFDPIKHTFQKIKFNTSISEDPDFFFIEDFLEMDETHMWLALRNLGPAKYNRETHQLDLIKGPDQFIGCQKFQRDAQNSIWGLSTGSGLIKFSNASTSIRYFLPDKDFSDFIITPNNQVIVTTRNNGLRVYAIESGILKLLYELNTTNQFPSNSLSQIALDRNNLCWIQFKNSLLSFNPETKKWKTYGAKDGLTGNLSYSELYATPEGEIFLTYGNGVYHFNEKSTSQTNATPPLILKSVQVMGKPISFVPNTVIHLAHDQNFLSFDFLALEYTKQHELIYAYQLEGLDQDWVISGSRHFAEYPDLKPGNYTFKIKVSNGDGIWSEPLQAMIIAVEPAWYQTWGFIIISALILIGITIISIRQYLINRFKKKLKQLEYQRNLEQVRNRIARDIHDEIGSGLTKISLLTARLENNEVTDRIKSSSKEIIGNLGDIIWAVNPANDTIQNFIAHLRDYTGRYFENTTCSARLQIVMEEESINTKTLSPDFKRNVMMIVKEGFNNILKHSDAKECTIEVRFSSHYLSLTIQDNGKLKTSESSGSGNGLMNMKKRATDLQGQLTWQQTNAGVHIELHVPIN